MHKLGVFMSKPRLVCHQRLISIQASQNYQPINNKTQESQNEPKLVAKEISMK